jgi:hypothetical protein
MIANAPKDAPANGGRGEMSYHNDFVWGHLADEADRGASHSLTMRASSAPNS